MCVGRPGVAVREPGREGVEPMLTSAHSPKAPSTCTQAPTSWAAATASANGSKAPEWMLPACRQTIVGPLGAAQRGSQGSGVEPALVVARQTSG